MQLQEHKDVSTNDSRVLSQAALELLDQELPALVLGRELRHKLPAYDQVRLNGAVYAEREAKTPEELGRLAQEIHKRLHSKKIEGGETLLNHLAQFPETREASEYGLKLAAQYTNKSVKEVIQSVFLENPELSTGEGKARAGAAIIEQMDGHYTRQFRPGVGKHFLAEMETDPKTKTAAEMANRLLESSKNPVQLIEWSLQNPTASSAEDFADFGAKADAGNGMLLLTELEKFPEAAETARWALELNGQLNRPWQRQVTAMVTEALEAPEQYVERLMALQDEQNIHNSDAQALSAAALNLLDQSTPALVMGNQVRPILEEHDLVRLNRALYNGKEAASPTELSELAQDMYKSFYGNKLASGEALLEHLKQFPELGAAAQYGLDLAATESFDNTEVKMALYTAALGNPTVDSGEGLAALATEIMENLNTYRAKPHRSRVGRHFLNEMKAFPETRFLSEAAERLLEASQDPLQVIQFALANPKISTPQELAAYGSQANLWDGKLLLQELSTHTETAEIASWSHDLCGKLSAHGQRALIERTTSELGQPTDYLETLLELESDPEAVWGDRKSFSEAALELSAPSPARELVTRLRPHLKEREQALVNRAALDNLQARTAKELAVVGAGCLKALPDKDRANLGRIIMEEVLDRPEANLEFWTLAIKFAAGRPPEEVAEIYELFLDNPSFDDLIKADPRSYGEHATLVAEVVAMTESARRTHGIEFDEDIVEIGDFHLAIND